MTTSGREQVALTVQAGVVVLIGGDNYPARFPAGTKSNCPSQTSEVYTYGHDAVRPFVPVAKAADQR
jgi:hypothetical protein